jgi:hypothetical protein
MRLVKIAAMYFAIVFGSAFVLGTFRVVLLVPRVGSRTAELLEMPLVFAAISLAARWVHRRDTAIERSAPALAVGLLALAMLLVAEIVVGGALRGLSPGEALLNRDPVSGTAYYAMLGVFALMPTVLSATSRARWRSPRPVTASDGKLESCPQATVRKGNP